MKTTCISLLSACLIAVLVASASGQEGGFKLPSFNPFGQKKKQSAPAKKKSTGAATATVGKR